MHLKIGAKITALRKEKGMTQEQVAAALGISPPAVSKWETDSSYPDITLLCPLARVLGTNVDTLLEFEEQPSEEWLLERLNEILETARTKDISKAEQKLGKLLHQYPTNAALKYYAYTAITMFEIFCPACSDEKRQEWKRQKTEYLEYVRESGNTTFWQPAVSCLASMAISSHDFERAEELIKELPKQSSDPDMLWSIFYLEKGNREEAQKATQKRLYFLVNQLQSCLALLMSEKMEPDAKRALEICEIYGRIEELFGCGGGMSAGMFMNIFLQMGEKEKALDSLCRFVDAYTSPMQMPKPLLFSEAVNTQSGEKATPRAMKTVLLRAMLSEEAFEPLRDNEKFKSAVEKLKKSIADDSRADTDQTDSKPV